MPTSAAAPPPTALNTLTSCGIAVIWTVLAEYSPAAPPTSAPAIITIQPVAAVAAISMAPASTMPWIEFAADIGGVCRVAGTLLITSKPTHRLRTKIVMSVSSAVDIGSTSRGRGQGRVHDAAVAGDHHPRLQF